MDRNVLLRQTYITDRRTHSTETSGTKSLDRESSQTEDIPPTVGLIGQTNIIGIQINLKTYINDTLAYYCRHAYILGRQMYSKGRHNGHTDILDCIPD
jgi:hypothetical protein